MKQMMTVFRFEFRNYLRSKPYRIFTVLFVLVIVAGMSYPRLSAMIRGGGESAVPDTQAEIQNAAVAVAPGVADAAQMAAGLNGALPLYAWEGADMDEAALTAAVEAGDYQVGLWLEGDLTYRYIVRNTSLGDTGEYMIAEAVTSLYQVREMTGHGLSPDQAAALMGARAQGETVVLEKDGLVTYIYTYALVMLLYMSVMMYGQMVAGGVAAEKSNRAMEMLITNARPTSLMLGKVLGTGCAGLLQTAMFVAAVYVGYALNLQYWGDNALMQAVLGMPASTLVYALVFFILGFFLYASLYAALGSLVSRSEEVSSVITPLIMLFVAVLILVMTAITSGTVDSALMGVASIVPFSSPMAMFVRITMGAPAAWEIALSIGLLAVSTVAVAFIAAGIYRVGVLLYGKPPKLKELYQAVKMSR